MAHDPQADRGPTWVTALLLFTTVILYSRPQGIPQSAILGILACMTFAAWVNDHPKPETSRRLLMGMLFCAAVLAASLQIFTTTGALVATSTFAIPLLAAWQASILRTATFAKVIDSALIALVIGSLLISVLRPDIGITQQGETQGSWRGVFDHRNTFGYVLILTSASSGAKWAQANFMSPIDVCTRLGLIAAGLVTCGSTTAVILSTAVLGLALAVRPNFRRNDENRLSKLILPFAAAALLIPVLSWWTVGAVSALGKEESIQGRTDIWAIAWRLIWTEPWVGYGRLDILQPGNPVAEAIQRETGFYVRSLHNGFLALALEVGVLTAILGLLFWLSALVGVTRAAKSNANDAALFLFLALAAITVTNMVETRVFVEIGWFLTCCAALVGLTTTSRPHDEAS